MKKNYALIAMIAILAIFLTAAIATTLDDFFMPGSQPGQSGTFDTPAQCAACHADYDHNAEPTYTWQGSMMAHAARDPLYLAALTIANQDADFSGDLCIRCHAPAGWLSGRSEPSDGSALTDADREGVQCHFCHKIIDPKSTYAEDLAYIATLTDIPPQSGNGMFIVDSDDRTRRGPFDDTNAKHPVLYRPFYSESEYCATCHDVSNPAFSKTANGTYEPNTLGAKATNFNTYEMFPVERTFSEWKMSAYNDPAGIPSSVFGGNKANVSTCQDCHMKDVTGYGCNKTNVLLRNDMPQHDLTGGNTFIPKLVAQLYPGEVNVNAINDGILRAEGMLKNAATMHLSVATSGTGYKASVEIINETGHKLPSGYPEGRRMWINIKGYDTNDNIIYESGAYNVSTAVLNETGAKIYEARLGMSPSVASAASDVNKTYVAGESFHFALNNVVVKDNRIPPRGFTNANFAAVQAAPVGYTYADGAYSDITEYTLPANVSHINVRLLYQTTSKEYVEFLRDENRTNNTGQTIYDLWTANGKSAPVVMNEADFYTDVLDLVEFEATLKKQLRIYPNPARDLVTIDLNDQAPYIRSIEVYTLNGQMIKVLLQGSIKNGESHLKWETAGLKPGTYIIKCNFTDRTLSQFVIIK